MMKKYCLILILSSSMALNSLSAHNNGLYIADSIPADYAQMLELALAKNDSLNKRRNELNALLRQTKKDAKLLYRQSQELKKIISRTYIEKQNSEEIHKDSGYDALVQRKEQLESSIVVKMDSLRQLTDALAELDNLIHRAETDNYELNRVKNEVSGKLLADNQSYIELPFSQLSLDSLRFIHEKCTAYTKDSQVRAFVEKIDRTIECKVTYDEVQKVLNSRYRKSDIDGGIVRLQALKNMSLGQKEEVRTAIRQLKEFEAGLKAFKEFITNLNRCREGVEDYTQQYYQNDMNQIMPASLKMRIDGSLLSVPYLKTKYDEFMGALMSDPSRHYDVEQEIMNQ